MLRQNVLLYWLKTFKENNSQIALVNFQPLIILVYSVLFVYYSKFCSNFFFFFYRQLFYFHDIPFVDSQSVISSFYWLFILSQYCFLIMFIWKAIERIIQNISKLLQYNGYCFLNFILIFTRCLTINYHISSA